jgi:zinc transport system permease protein
MFEVLQIPFMQRALIAGFILALLLAVLGVFVVLRKMAFFSDGIAHASLAGVALSIMFAFAPLLGAIIASAVFATFIYLMEDKLKSSSDAAIGIIFATGLSLGVLIMSASPGYQPELISYLFGNILAISKDDLLIISVVSAVILALVMMVRRKLTLFALNEDLALVSGINTKLLKLSLYLMLAVGIVLAVKILGIILVSALLIVPVASSQLLARSFKTLAVFSVILSELIVVLGIFGSYYLDLPTGPTIVVFGAIVFAVIGTFKSLFKLN